MDPNLCPDGAGFDDLPLGFPSAMIDYTPHFLIQGFDEEITTIQQPPINIGSESYHGGMGHFHQEFANFQRAFMDHPIRFDPQAAPCFTAPELPGNIGSDQDSGMIFESGLGSTESLRLPSVAPTSNNPLMEIVQRATSSSLGQTRRATSRRTYKKFNREDVEALILEVEKSENRTSWKSIAEIPRFKEKGRTDLQLSNKWRHMTETDDDKKDPKMKDLYDRAKDVKRIRGEMN